MDLKYPVIIVYWFEFIVLDGKWYEKK